jgi:hypothetical protein
MNSNSAHAAPPEPSPYRELLRALDARLRVEAPTRFAGTARSSDGGINVYVTAADASVNAVVEALQTAVGGSINVYVVSGLKYSLATLESLRDELLAQHQTLAARGIRLVEFGIDVRSNKVRVGVNRLDASKTAYLNAHFGRDRIEVFEGGEWEPTSC